MPRTIYSLQLDLYPRATGKLLQLIAPLDAHGQSPHIRPQPPKKRVVDLPPGDRLRHWGRPFRVKAIRVHLPSQCKGSPDAMCESVTFRGWVECPLSGAVSPSCSLDGTGSADHNRSDPDPRLKLFSRLRFHTAVNRKDLRPPVR